MAESVKLSVPYRKRLMVLAGLNEGWSIHDDLIQQIIASHSIKELVHYDWDKLAFGFSQGDIIEVPINKIIPEPEDMKNVIGYDMRRYFGGVDFNELPLIELYYKKGKFIIKDGHHRYGYAKELGLKSVKAIVDIRDNPFVTLGFYIDDLVAEKQKMA